MLNSNRLDFWTETQLSDIAYFLSLQPHWTKQSKWYCSQREKSEVWMGLPQVHASFSVSFLF